VGTEAGARDVAGLAVIRSRLSSGFSRRSCEPARRLLGPSIRRVNSDMMPGRYRHFKGGEYEVLLVAKDVETEEPVVVYQALYGERGHWVRSLEDFTAHVARDGYDGPRFVPLTGR
jgi:hypothetical protein